MDPILVGLALLTAVNTGGVLLLLRRGSPMVRAPDVHIPPFPDIKVPIPLCQHEEDTSAAEALAGIRDDVLANLEAFEPLVAAASDNAEARASLQALEASAAAITEAVAEVSWRQDETQKYLKAVKDREDAFDAARAAAEPSIIVAVPKKPTRFPPEPWMETRFSVVSTERGNETKLYLGDDGAKARRTYESAEESKHVTVYLFDRGQCRGVK